MEMELDLVSDCKESKGHNVVVAKMFVCSLSSQPVDHEENNKSAGNENLILRFIYNTWELRCARKGVRLNGCEEERENFELKRFIFVEIVKITYCERHALKLIFYVDLNQPKNDKSLSRLFGRKIANENFFILKYRVR